MSEKPSYLGLLNAIAVGEARGHQVLDAWARSTPCAELAGELRMIAIREAEHAAAFRKRLSELGFQVRQTPPDRFADDLACAGSSASDQEKFQRLITSDSAGRRNDALTSLFQDPTIDAETGALLGRFIAEERDTQRRLEAACQRLAARDTRKSGTAERTDGPALSADRDNPQEDALLGEILARLDRLGNTLETLKTLRPR
ncbi:MAG: hypothetical protein R3E82_01190 [Pseudomonadales bacterium]|nr:hypothetical protein [Pseudomonadales bacterium]